MKEHSRRNNGRTCSSNVWWGQSSLQIKSDHLCQLHWHRRLLVARSHQVVSCCGLTFEVYSAKWRYTEKQRLWQHRLAVARWSRSSNSTNEPSVAPYMALVDKYQAGLSRFHFSFLLILLLKNKIKNCTAPSCDAIITKSVRRQSGGLSKAVLATVSVSKVSFCHHDTQTHTVTPGTTAVTQVALLGSLYYI